MIDKTDAPDGYKAIKDTGDEFTCSRCAFDYSTVNCSEIKCLACERVDGEDVVFELIDTLPGE